MSAGLPIGEQITETGFDKIPACVKILLAVTEGSEQPFVIADSRGRVEGCNSAYCRLTGYAKDEIKGLRCEEDLTPAEWRTMESEVIRAQVKSKMPAIYAKEYKRKDGSIVPVELYSYLLFDGNNLPIFYCAFIRDLTRKRGP